MPKPTPRFVIEHWRDGEVIATYPVNEEMVERSPDGTGRVVFPPGTITLNTGDELRFNVASLIERLGGTG